MTPEQFKAWRTHLELNQDEAAKALGLGKSTVQLYERGHRAEDGRPIEIPKAVELACYAVARGVESYDGSPVRKVKMV